MKNRWSGGIPDMIGDRQIDLIHIYTLPPLKRRGNGHNGKRLMKKKPYIQTKRQAEILIEEPP